MYVVDQRFTAMFTWGTAAHLFLLISFTVTSSIWATKCAMSETLPMLDTWKTTLMKGKIALPKKRAIEQIEPMEVVQRYTVDFHQTLEKLNNLSPQY